VGAAQDTPAHLKFAETTGQKDHHVVALQFAPATAENLVFIPITQPADRDAVAAYAAEQRRGTLFAS
jgi:hypothetical protein